MIAPGDRAFPLVPTFSVHPGRVHHDPRIEFILIPQWRFKDSKVFTRGPRVVDSRQATLWTEQFLDELEKIKRPS